MLKLSGTVSAIFLLASAIACDEAGPEAYPTGSVGFDLAIPGGQTVESVQMHLVCPASGVDLTHTFDVVNGEVVAVIGGLLPGDCTVTMTTQTKQGSDCLGTKTFTVLPGLTVDVVVELICQGINDGPAGSAKVSANLRAHECADDRIKTIFAIPANLLLGESTTVEVQIHEAAVKGTPKYTFKLRNDDDNSGQGTLAETTCKAGSATCNRFTCTGLGANPAPDGRTGLPSAGVYVSVTYEDDECFDTEEAWVYCLEGSTCGDGAKEGVEECDDGNTTSDDGCSALCKQEVCGDGVRQQSLGEECDGTDGVGQGQSCSVECELVEQGAEPTCGDGVKNQASEQCDGADGLLANQQCSETCTIVPICGNNVVEGTEACDDVGNPACVNCQLQTQTGDDECAQCIAALPEIGEFEATVCKPNQQCVDALSCLLDNASCWTTLAPAACFCGNSQADIDACENPSFEPTGDCAATLRAGAGGAANADVLSRYFDLNYPTGNATVIMDSAFTGCNEPCF